VTIKQTAIGEWWDEYTCSACGEIWSVSAEDGLVKVVCPKCGEKEEP
jgi:predicted RNA-binding Zn-ribbon protein involved in translation (DUF1610 family)